MLHGSARRKILDANQRRPQPMRDVRGRGIPDESCHLQPKSGDSRMNFDKELDARGLSCPLPILKTKKTLNDLQSRQVLKVVATDPGSIKDMQAFSNQTGNVVLSSTGANKTYVFYPKKK